MSAMAVSVVPMPRWSTLACAAWKIDALASATAATTTSRLAAPAPRRSRRMSTASWLATSPARWPPIPSAMPSTIGSAT